ncbi:hypothetical protein ACWDUC_24495 [Streptomyces tricolor]
MQGTGGQAELGRGPADIETLELTERDEGLAAARAANRDLMAQLNR